MYVKINIKKLQVLEGKKEPLFMYLFYLMAPHNNLDVDLFKQVLKKADLSLVQVKNISRPPLY